MTATLKNTDELRKRAREHREHDDYIQGDYVIFLGREGLDSVEEKRLLQLFGLQDRDELPDQERFFGCMVGCLANPADAPREVIAQNSGVLYARLENQFGIPYPLAEACDVAFESCDDRTEAADFVIAFAEAAQDGVKIPDRIGGQLVSDLKREALIELVSGKVPA